MLIPGQVVCSYRQTSSSPCLQFRLPRKWPKRHTSRLMCLLTCRIFCVGDSASTASSSTRIWLMLTKTACRKMKLAKLVLTATIMAVAPQPNASAVHQARGNATVPNLQQKIQTLPEPTLAPVIVGAQFASARQKRSLTLRLTMILRQLTMLSTVRVRKRARAPRQRRWTTLRAAVAAA